VEALLFPYAIYAFGVLGLAGIGALPLRVWFSVSRFRQLGAAAATTLVILSVGALAAEALLLRRLFPCLSDEYCGPNRGYAWILLAMFGFVYLIFELLVCAVRLVGRKMETTSVQPEALGNHL